MRKKKGTNNKLKKTYKNGNITVLKSGKSLFVQYLLCVGIGLSLTVLMLLVQGIFNVEEKPVREFMRIFHNAFFVAGALESVFAGFAFVAGKGAFLGIGYALGRVAILLFPFRGKTIETYAQYRERKTGQSKGKTELPLLFTGLGFIAISFIFLRLWYIV